MKSVSGDSITEEDECLTKLLENEQRKLFKLLRTEKSDLEERDGLVPEDIKQHNGQINDVPEKLTNSDLSFSNNQETALMEQVLHSTFGRKRFHFNEEEISNALLQQCEHVWKMCM